MNGALSEPRVPLYRLRVAKEVGNLLLVGCCLAVLGSVRAWTGFASLLVAQVAYFAAECVFARIRERVDPDALQKQRADPLLLIGAVVLNVYFHVLLLTFAEVLGGTVGVFGCVDYLLNSSERLVSGSPGRIGCVFCTCSTFYLGAVKAVDLFWRPNLRVVASTVMIFISFAAAHEVLQALVYVLGKGDLTLPLTSAGLAAAALALALAGVVLEPRAAPEVSKAVVISACWSAFAARAIGLAEAANEPGIEAHAMSAALTLVLSVFVSASNAPLLNAAKKTEKEVDSRSVAVRFISGAAGSLRRRGR